jgi:rare lipoprotein A
MKWNASLSAALLLLAGCSAGGYSNYAPEPGLSPAAQALPSYARQDPGYRPGAASRERPTLAYDAPDAGYDQPAGGDYAQPAPAADTGPGAGYSRPDEQALPAYAQPNAGGQDLPPYVDPAAGATGPSGSSQGGETRYDEVGYAGVRTGDGGTAVVAAHRSLPPNSFLEVTSLETGRTILVLVTGSMPGADHPIDLSPAAAQLLGASGTSIPVRIRKVTPPPVDQAALRNGQAASERSDAPPVLLTALRKRLPARGGYGAATAPGYARAAPPPPRVPASSRPAPAARGGNWYVQVAALSNGARAQSLASSLGGFVRPGGGLYRVQMGPFRSAGEANAARSRAAQSGFGDARVFTQN